MNKFSLRVFDTDDITILTQNKIATRYLRNVLNTDSYNVRMIINYNGSIDFEFESDYNDNHVIDNLYKIYKSTNTKPCLMLIRNPEKRLVTGLVQDILDEFKRHFDSPFFYDFLIKKVPPNKVTKFIDAFNITYNQTTWEDVDSYNEFSKLVNSNGDSDLDKFIWNIIFETYIKLWSDLNNWERGHNNIYLFSFYELYRKNNDITVIDIDNDDDLISYLMLNNYKTEFPKRSNSYFKNLLEEFMSNNINLSRRLSTVVNERDYYFYKYLRQ